MRCGKSKVRGSRRRQITDGNQRRKAVASSPRIAAGSVKAVIVRCIHRGYPLRAENRARPAERAVNMAEERLIRKYANRRLYDAEESRHVTLDDLRKLIASGQRIKVIDDKSGEDITRGVLLQIIASQEQFGTPVLSLQLLEAIIRFYGNPIQQMLTSYLEQSIGGLLRQQNLMQQEMAKALETPMAPIAEMARQNMEMWAKMQASMLSAVTPTPASGAAGTPPPKPESPKRRG
ncbi:MAG: polyhydroxyalkanoate synthesis repressor PhaR [Gammaproteobacteria bacterium]|nr:MAG: polyhydroxyalkanoate synthesis repressor PhaR [Gammaproteobacteria bacterium]